MKKVAIAFIGTGKYADFFPKWKLAVDKHFLNNCEKTIFVFTDKVEEEYFHHDNIELVKVPSYVWPEASLYRFKFLDVVIKDLYPDFCQNYDYLFYIDSDLNPVNDIKLNEIIVPGKKMVGVQHPGNAQNPGWHTLETRQESSAYVDVHAWSMVNYVYHQGCFWGGESATIAEMVSTLSSRIKDDASRDIAAVWIDESHMNAYFFENMHDVNTLSFSYAFPEEGDWGTRYPDIEVKMLHLTKCKIEYPSYPSHTGKGSR